MSGALDAATDATADTSLFTGRLDRVRARMDELSVDALALSVGPELPYLTGYEAMPLERLTLLVVRRDRHPVLLVPELEAPRVRLLPDVFELETWEETQDPSGLAAGALDGASVVGIGDRTWARFLVELSDRLPSVSWRRASDVVGPVRAVKDAAEIAALAAAGAAADRVAAALQGGEVALAGRTEADVSAELGRRLLAEGHDRVNFAIVAAGANAASPHHHPGDRVIRRGDGVLCDFGGTMSGPGGVGYCSDTTRVVVVGASVDEAPAGLRDAYAALREAQRAAVEAAVVGVSCESIDRVARRRLADDGWAEWFVHRTGHGIGIEEHEDPYIVEGNAAPVDAGHAFSIEPGVYVPGEWGIRLEDIVVATDAGPVPMNRSDHSLVAVDA